MKTLQDLTLRRVALPALLCIVVLLTAGCEPPNELIDFFPIVVIVTILQAVITVILGGTPSI